MAVSLAVISVCAFASADCSAQDSANSGTTRFVLNGNRMYAELGFVRPDCSVHRALAFVDMGSPSMLVGAALFDSLHLDQQHPLVFTVEKLRIAVPVADVTSVHRQPFSVGSDLDVEAMLPAGVLQRYRVEIDYRKRTMTFAEGSTRVPEGIAVPFQINPQTGLIAVDALIDGRHYPITIDNGSAYTWIRGDSASSWLTSHPGWAHGVGAVGTSNMTMTGDGTETKGTMMRIPAIAIGPLVVRDVGALAAGAGATITGNLSLFDWYARKNAVPVIGWIGGNVLKHYRVTIDYPNRMMYWVKQSELDGHEIDQVGLTLRSDEGAIYVAAIATKSGRATVEGVLPGDKLIRVGDLEISKASHGAIYDALHGRPGESRTLVLERDGARITVNATVTAF